MNPTNRFSDRVDNYVKYRPHYPMQIIKELETAINFNETWTVADVGSGTGISTHPFLVNGNKCYGIEPNTPMREAAEKWHSVYPNFHSINGTAETTELPDKSINLIVAGQAFHWFTVEKAQQEFQRILKPTGYVLLLWNKRHDQATAFMKAYNEFLLTFSTDYQKVNLRRVDFEVYDNFFKHAAYEHRKIPNQQVFNLEGLKGRYLSSSYAFDRSHKRHQDAMTALEDLFDQHAENGKVVFHYHTGLYFGMV